MMEDTNANSIRNLALKSLLENERVVFIVGRSKPSLLELLNGAEPITHVMRCDDEFDIERVRREMKSIGLSLDNSIDELRPPPVFPIEKFQDLIISDPAKHQKRIKSLEWKNKLKSLYRVKI